MKTHTNQIKNILDTGLQNSIHEKAKYSANVAFSRHALDRLKEREITATDVIRVLRTGYFSQPVTSNKLKEEYKFKFEGHVRGVLVAVVGVVRMSGEGKIFVITTEYVQGKEDPDDEWSVNRSGAAWQ